MEKLGSMFRQSYDIAISVLSELTASECALVLMLTDYQLVPKKAVQLLDVLRDMPLLKDDIGKACNDGISFALVGADIERLFDRINNPRQYWYEHTKVEELQLWLVPFRTTVDRTQRTAGRDTGVGTSISAAEFDSGRVPKDGHWYNLHATDRSDISVWANAGDFYSDNFGFICNTDYYQGAFNSVEVETDDSYLGYNSCRACGREEAPRCSEHEHISYGPSLSSVDDVGRGYTCVINLNAHVRRSRRELKYLGDIDGAVVLSVLHGDIGAGPLAKKFTGTYYITVA